jgi:uncharacterized protein
MVIDAHQHPHPHVVKDMNELGIDASVLLPVGDDAFTMIQERMVEAPGRFIPFYWIRMDDIGGSVQELETAVKNHGVKGVKFQPLVQHEYHDERRLYPVYEKCAQLGLVVTFHSGIVAFYKEFGIPHLARYTNPLPLDQVAYDFPGLRIIIAHMGGNYHYEALLLAEKHEHIYMDTAYLPFFCRRLLPKVTPLELIQRAVDIIGPERVLYGFEGFHPDEIRFSTLSDPVKEQILGGNAAALFGVGSGEEAR